LFEAYRQVCADHLEGTVRSLKLFPGATADSSLGAAAAKAQQAVTKFVRLDKERAATLLDHLLWLESEVDQGHYETISKLPGFRQDTPAILSRGATSPARRPTPTLLKTNLQHLIKEKGVYQSDIAFETGIPKSTIARACAFGTLQASWLPALSNYFGLTLDDLVTRDLACSEQIQDSHQSESPPLLDIGTRTPKTPRIPQQPQKSVAEGTQEQPPDALAETIMRNLRSLLLENNLTALQLSGKSGVDYAAIFRFLRGEYLPRGQSLTKIAQAFGIPETDILDQHRDSIVVNPRIVRSNLEAILACRSLPSATYANQLRIGTDAIKEILAVGEISASQAHKIANKEGISVRQFVSEDLSPKYPASPPIDSTVVARNIRTLCLERGLYPAQIATKAAVDPSTVLNYGRNEIQRLDRSVLTKIAAVLGLDLAEIVDPMRPVLEVTHF
jgi:transcriptional regulator with XRE-family HTH domain